MSKLTALIEAAKAATSGPWSDTRYQEIYVGHDPENMIIGPDDESIIAQNVSDDNSTFIALANPAIILELCALLEKAEEALETCTEGDYSTGHVIHPSFDDASVNQSLAAIKQWKEQT